MAGSVRLTLRDRWAGTLAEHQGGGAATDRRKQGDTRPFRQRLDDILRTRDPDAVRDFLIAEGQWDEDAAGDTEFAMWMMIAGSPALAKLHAEAEAWLSGHGHAAEADIIAGNRKRSGQHDGRRRGGPQGSGPGGSHGQGPGERPTHLSRQQSGQRPPHRSGRPRPRP